MSSTLQIRLDDELAALLAARAADTGLREEEVVVSAIRRELSRGRLTEILDRGRKDTSLSEGEAMSLAIAEQKAARAERRSAS